MTYNPEIFTGSSLVEMRNFLELELRKIAAEFVEQTAVELRPTAKEPERPRDGMLIFADGTNFNPGAGAGTYERRANAWVKL